MSKQAKFWLASALVATMAAAPALAETAAPKPAEAQPAAKPADARKVTADTVVATVNGTKITLGEMIALRNQLPAQYQALPDKTLFAGILDQLVQQTLLEQKMEGKLSYEEQLQLANSKRVFLASLALKKVEEAAVTPEALKAAYDQQFANYKPAMEYHAEHILVKTKKEAEDILAQLNKGADFAELAKKYSTDKATAPKGGDLGWFKPQLMVKPFGDAVVAMKDGALAGPVQTQFGWHVIKLLGTKEVGPKSPPTLEQVTPQLSKLIAQKAVGDELKKLQDGAKVSKDVEGIDPSVLKDDTLLMKK